MSNLGNSPCRPGDSIRIGRGSHVAEGIQLQHPLQLVGCPGSALVCRKHQASCALNVRANVRLENLHVSAQRSACVQQHCGRLEILRCQLHCDPQRFDHLYCALVTRVRGSTARPYRQITDLHVHETVISGSLRAIDCCGDGVLRNVRVVFDGLQKHFWFSVVQDVPVPAPAPAWQVDCASDSRVDDVWRPMEQASAASQELAVQKSMAHKRRRIAYLGECDA